MAQFGKRLLARAALVDLPLSREETERLETYYGLLRIWNRRINLTSLPLEPATDEALDRLFVEPAAAARFLKSDSRFPFASASSAPHTPQWVDLGSGGGSPAIPMKIALPMLEVTMIESRSRKAAFLREVVRALDLRGVKVLSERFEDVHEQDGLVDLVTVRAVRTDDALAAAAARLLGEGRWLLVFTSAGNRRVPAGFAQIATVSLSAGRSSFVHVFARMFHVEHTA
jgi:16S rRNA (guanine527-N7)-methyltransferase